MERIVIASNNKGKLREIKDILNNYEIISLKESGCEIEVDEDQETFEGNSLKKAKEISKMIDMPCIADDSGICIEKLNGWPGVHTARFLGPNKTDRQRNEAILEKMRNLKGKERNAEVVCVMTYYYNERKVVAKGVIKGKIAVECRGTNGFGFDEIFELESGKTLAELSSEEKNELSSRKLALEKLKKLI